MAGTFSPLEENVAVLVDVLVNTRISQWQQDTFDPERWSDHAERARAEKRNTTPPPVLPAVQPLAVRPAGWVSRTEQLFAAASSEPAVVDVEGEAARRALDALFEDDPI